jgi:hypothetical protein
VKLGECTAYIINRKKALKGYYGANFQACLDQKSHELIEFATLLFDRKGRLRPEYWANPVKKGAGVWDPDVNEGDLCLVDTLHVNEKQRGKGVDRSLVESVHLKLTGQV